MLESALIASPGHLALALLCALLAGIAKTGLPGLGVVAVGLIAWAVPPKESIGLLLGLLVIGDSIAVIYYKKHANMRLLALLLPFIFGGMLIGTLTLSLVKESSIRPILGVLMLSLLFIDFARRRTWLTKLKENQSVAIGVGTIAGFCTVMGNVAGPLMAIYFVLLGMNKYNFMGTAAWLFFIINISKIPIYISINVITAETLKLFFILAPFTLIGSLLGVKLLKIIEQRTFDRLIFVFAMLSAAWLIISTLAL